LKKNRVHNPNRLRNYAKISFIIMGVIWGAIATFFGVGAILLLILGGPVPGGNGGTAFLILSFSGGALFGGWIGYFIYRKSKYSKLEYF
jgi:hypothetical protein